MHLAANSAPVTMKHRAVDPGLHSKNIPFVCVCIYIYIYIYYFSPDTALPLFKKNRGKWRYHKEKYKLSQIWFSCTKYIYIYMTTIYSTMVQQDTLKIILLYLWFI
jgi:hypothetical protein